MNNILKKKFIFEINKNNKIEIFIPEDVFFPTGTTKVLFESVKEYIVCELHLTDNVFRLSLAFIWAS